MSESSQRRPGLGRLRSARRVTWRTILGILLVPTTAAGVLLWGLWNPTERLETVTAAVVNLDEPVEVEGQLVPMGRVLAAELIAGGAAAGTTDAGGDTAVATAAADSEAARTNFTWLLTDLSDAEAGLDDGRYATVIVIPENFSSAATSVSRGAGSAEQATIDVRTSERGRLLDPALSSIVTSTAMSVLNEQLGAQFVGNIFVGMAQLGDGLGEAADGANQLADGGDALASGGADLAGGAQQLAEGTAEFASGLSQLSSGAAELSNGVGQLAAGANGLAVGAEELAVGARDAALGGAQLATGLEAYTGSVNTVVQGLIDQSATALVPLRQVRELLALLPEDTLLPEGQTPESVLAMIDGLIAEVEAAANESDASQLVQLRNAGTQLAQGVRASADGQQQLADGLTGFSGGLWQYAAGVGELSAGAEQFSSSTPQLEAGAAQLAEGSAELAEGTSQLADGVRQAADGQRKVADGLTEAAGGVPAYSDAERDRISQTMVSPVGAQGAPDELFNASGVPLFAGIALWAGAFAAFLVLAPLWRRTREAARGVGYVTTRSVLPALAIGAAQGALAGVILPLLLGYDLSQGLGFFALAVVAGTSFALVNQGLSALLGGFGRFVAFALLVVAFAVGVISTAPAALQAIGDGSPIGALFGGFQAIATGSTGAGAAIWALALWGCGGAGLTAIAVARARKRAA